MAEALSYYVAPIFLGHRVSDCTALEAKVNNGTIFFVECDGQPLAITADHVYAGYLERKESEFDLIVDPVECILVNVRLNEKS